MIIDNADETELFFKASRPPGKADGLLKVENQGPGLATYIPECSHGAILVTTRNKQAGVKLTKGRAVMEVPRMDLKDGQDLVSTRLPDTDLDPKELETLVEQLEYFPLALVQAASFILQESTSLDEYRRRSPYPISLSLHFPRAREQQHLPLHRFTTTNHGLAISNLRERG